MTAAEPPAAVRRYRDRPLAWLLPVALFLGAMFVGDLVNADRRAERRRAAVPVVGAVVAHDAEDGRLRVAYDHPLNGEQFLVDTRLPPGAEPAAGDRIDLLVSRRDPGHAMAAEDGFDLTAGLVGRSPLLGIPVLFWAVRLRWVRRTRRLMTVPAPSFAMLAALRPPRSFGRRCELHLFPLDAHPGARSVCTVPVVSTGGVPITAGVFPVEVKGVPRPRGHVVARAGETVLWPGGRALLGRRTRRPEAVAAVSPLRRRAVHPDNLPRPSWWRSVRGELLCLAAAMAFGGLVVVLTHDAGTAAARLMARGVPIVGQVVDHEGDDDLLVMTYRQPGDTSDRVARVEVDFASDHPVGRRYAIRVDPETGARGRLVHQPYDAFAAVVWGFVPAALVAGVVVHRRHWWWRSRRLVASGLWYDMTGWIVGVGPWRTRLAIGPRVGVPSILLAVPAGPAMQALCAARGPARVALAGTASPGAEAVVLVDDTLILPTGPALAPEFLGDADREALLLEDESGGDGDGVATPIHAAWWPLRLGWALLFGSLAWMPALAAHAAAAAIGLPAPVPLGMALVVFALIVSRAVRLSVRTDDDGMVVRNPFLTYRWRWADVEGFERTDSGGRELIGVRLANRRVVPVVAAPLWARSFGREGRRAAHLAVVRFERWADIRGIRADVAPPSDEW